ncbi:MAG: hypothetical protein WC516_05275 [Patescibacteria group bacterium]|jgi:hypothetical protein
MKNLDQLLEKASQSLSNGLPDSSMAYSLLAIAHELRLIRQQFGEQLKQNDKLISFTYPTKEEYEEEFEKLQEETKNNDNKWEQLEFDFYKKSSEDK